MNSPIKVKELCKSAGITLDDLKSESKLRKVMNVRIQLAVMLKENGLDNEEIGFLLGKTGSTIGYYLKVHHFNRGLFFRNQKSN